MYNPLIRALTDAPRNEIVLGFSSTTGLDPVLTAAGVTDITWTAPSGAVSTGTTPSPALDESGEYVIATATTTGITGLDANTDSVTKFIPVIGNTGLATLDLSDNPALDVDMLVSTIHALRRQLPAMTVDIGGTCAGVTLTSYLQIDDLVDNYSHTWTKNGGALLNNYAATAAYSVARLLRWGYTGNAILVRRASDDAEQAIGFVDGALDTASLATFCSGTDGFVKTIYDQQGSANATQTNGTRQGKIYDSSTGVNLDGGKPSIEGDGYSNYPISTEFTTLTAFSIFAVAKGASSSAGYRGIYSPGSGAAGAMMLARVNSGQKWGTYSSGTANSDFLADQELLEMHSSDGNAGNFYLSNVSDGTFSATEGQPAHIMGVPTHDLEGSWQETIFYNTDQTASRAAIAANINAFYSIY